jgi:hypothetical protein
MRCGRANCFRLIASQGGWMELTEFSSAESSFRTCPYSSLLEDTDLNLASGLFDRIFPHTG